MARAEVAPSILAADFGRLGDQVQEVVDAGARTIHVDVMDGHFVPPLSMGPQVVSALRDRFGGAIVLDCHLMVERPERQVEAFASAGADGVTVHAEATPHVHFALQAVREAGMRAGLAVNPATPLSVFETVACDLALCMTVNPGWGGQPFIAGSEARIATLAARLADGTALEVDGGIDPATAGPCARAGATTFVAGSAVFRAPDPGEAYRAIAAAVGAAA
jgi:ribulose-phosphate 3-epimerase